MRITVFSVKRNYGLNGSIPVRPAAGNRHWGKHDCACSLTVFNVQNCSGGYANRGQRSVVSVLLDVRASSEFRFQAHLSVVLEFVWLVSCAAAAIAGSGRAPLAGDPVGLARCKRIGPAAGGLRTHVMRKVWREGRAHRGYEDPRRRRRCRRTGGVWGGYDTGKLGSTARGRRASARRAVQARWTWRPATTCRGVRCKPGAPPSCYSQTPCSSTAARRRRTQPSACAVGIGKQRTINRSVQLPARDVSRGGVLGNTQQMREDREFERGPRSSRRHGDGLAAADLCRRTQIFTMKPPKFYKQTLNLVQLFTFKSLYFTNTP
jgi:hypothetical protein